MSDILIPDSLMKEVLIEVAQRSINFDEVTYLSAEQAGGRLGIPAKQFSRLASEHLDLGPRIKRYSLAHIKKIAEKHRIILK